MRFLFLFFQDNIYLQTSLKKSLSTHYVAIYKSIHVYYMYKSYGEIKNNNNNDKQVICLIKIVI